MYSQKIVAVHGYSVAELIEMLRDTSRILSRTFSLNSMTLGGWTSFNILVEKDDAQYVLKLPAIIGPHETNPYHYQYTATSQISKEGLCPTPVEIGCLSNRNETPYCIYEYVEGEIRPSISSLTHDDLKNISSHLSQFSTLTPTNLNVFSKPSEYLVFLIQATDSIFEVHPTRNSLLKTARSKLVGMLEFAEQLDSTTKWTSKLMHGDLHESNIVFSPNGLYFLDLEACCYGEPLYDYSYLLIESDEDDSSKELESLRASQSDSGTCWALDMLAAVSITAWTLNRLLNIEANRVDPLLSTVEVQSAMLTYLTSKLRILDDLSPTN